jgi:Zn-dependent peptidase ImmA (M78 family)
MRQTLRLQPDWARSYPTWTDALRALRLATEAAGVMTVFNGVVGNDTHRKLSVAEFRGFVLADQYAPLIFVNAADAKAAQMLTLSHELAHLWLGEGGVVNLPKMQPAHNAVERFCNSVAAEFLVPAEALREHWPAEARSEERFQTLARRFKISPLVVARRAMDLQLVSKAAFLKFYGAYMEEEHRLDEKKAAGGDFYATLEMRVGQRLGRAVVRAATEGRLLYRDAYQLTGLRGATFNRYAKGSGAGY